MKQIYSILMALILLKFIDNNYLKKFKRYELEMLMS